jgi:hypothetical protein
MAHAQCVQIKRQKCRKARELCVQKQIQKKPALPSHPLLLPLLSLLLLLLLLLLPLLLLLLLLRSCCKALLPLLLPAAQQHLHYRMSAAISAYCYHYHKNY